VKGREGKVDGKMGGRKDVRYDTTRNETILMTPVSSYGCIMYSDTDFSFLVATYVCLLFFCDVIVLFVEKHI
jgi:hypothetical protein